MFERRYPDGAEVEAKRFVRDCFIGTKGRNVKGECAMVRTAEGEHGITQEERRAYEERFAAFREFAARERGAILKALEG